jgi:iron uptake system component EfeO
MKRFVIAAPVIVAATAVGCAPTDPILAVKADIDTQLGILADAAVALQNAAPAADADGWNRRADTDAVSAMEREWKKARVAYERVEGAIAVLFPDLDVAIDERYDGFIETAPDDNLFDGSGVTGMHGIERILWSDRIPTHVLAFEEALPHYRAAAFPTTQQQAADFKDGLVGRLVSETAQMRDDFAPLALDASAAFRGVIGSLEEQLEKVALASTGEDESRYAQHTLADMRANLAGGRSTWEHFRASVSEAGGEDVVARVDAGFARVQAAYDDLDGDAIPAVPATWNQESPSADDLSTPYGRLFALLSTEADPDDADSLVTAMNAAADLLGIPQLP